MNFLNKNLGFVGNVGTLLTGKAGAFALAVIAVPVISRLFAPEEFGSAALFIAFANVLVIVGTLQYEMALVLPESDAKAAAIARGLIIIALAVAGLMLLVFAIMALAEQWPRALAQVGPAVWLLPLAVVLLALARMLEAWLLRRKKFSRLAAADVTQAAGSSAARIGSGVLLGSTVGGLVGGFLFGIVAKIAVLANNVRALRRGAYEEAEPVRGVLREYADFPKFNAPAGLLRSLSQNLPVILLGLIFAPAVTGLYAMASRLILTPLEIVLQAFRRAFLRKASEIHNRGDSLAGAFAKTVGTFALLGLVPFVVLFFFGEEILTFVLGDDWAAAGRYAEILSPLLPAGWIAAPAATMMVVLRQQRLWLWLQCLTLLLVVAAFMVVQYLGATPEFALRLFVMVIVASKLLVIAIVVSMLRGGSTRLKQVQGVAGGSDA